MYYTIYKVTNKLSGKFYIGKHETNNLDDNYYGSGVHLKRAIKKYGKENFTKEILFVFDTEEEMNAKEKELVTDELILSESNYNKGPGGEGGAHFKGRKHSEETIQKIKLKRKEQVITYETRCKISESNIQRHKNGTLGIGMTGKTHAAETKKKIGLAMSKATKGKPKPWLKGRVPWNKKVIAGG